MKRIVLIIFCLINVQAFAQWKSYYPEEKGKKQKQEETE